MNELDNEEEVLLILRRRILLNSHVNVGVTHLLTGHHISRGVGRNRTITFLRLFSTDKNWSSTRVVLPRPRARVPNKLPD